MGMVTYPVVGFMLLLGFGGVGCRSTSQAQAPHPDDLAVLGSSGSLLPGRENVALEIGPDGKGRFTRYLPDDFGPPLDEIEFTLSPADLEAIWTAIRESDFFSLDEKYAPEDVRDGSFAALTITANGRTHRVDVENTTVPRFERLLEAINRITPSGVDLSYPHITPD